MPHGGVDGGPRVVERDPAFGQIQQASEWIGHGITLAAGVLNPIGDRRTSGRHSTR
jgi:hypothetical protein